MTHSQKPRLAISIGDAAGVGPEVVVAAWNQADVHSGALPLVVGHPELLRRAARLRKLDLEVVEYSPDAVARGQWAADADTIPCLRAGNDDVLDAPRCAVDRRTGEAAYQCVRLAAQLAIDNLVDGVVTAPLNKAALQLAGHVYPGHTELLADMCGVTDFAMMLYLPPGELVRSPSGLGVVHVTLHQSLRSVFDDLTVPAIVAKCHLADRAMRRLGVGQPRLAVAALNPHAGEQGLFGDEEQTVVAPAVAQACQDGLNVSGPLPTDTLMVAARDGQFDAVVALYHDQGHIALKLLGMHSAVNITLGLPIVRTSVAHGTAFDRAWQGTACADGMVAAVATATRLALTK